MLRTRAIHLKPLVYAPGRGRGGQRDGSTLAAEGSWRLSWIKVSQISQIQKYSLVPFHSYGFYKHTGDIFGVSFLPIARFMLEYKDTNTIKYKVLTCDVCS